MTGAAAAAAWPFPDIAEAKPFVKPKVRINGFDFDSREPIPAEKPYRDISAFQNKLIMHILAMNVSLLGIKLMLWVLFGSGEYWVVKYAVKYFGPLIHMIYGLAMWA